MRRQRPRAPIALLLLLAGALPALASSPADLFEQGNTAYEDGRYDDAAAAYERILRYGLRDPRVHYNLGNAYFKLGRLGSSILQYERALRIDPSDREARENLEFARSRIRDRVSEPEMPYPIRALTGALDRTSTGATTATFLTFYLAAGGLVGTLGLVRSYGWRRALGYAALLAGVLAALAGGGLYYKVDQITAEQAIVVREKLDVRSGPAEDNTVLFTVHEGTRVELRNRLDDWYQVSLPNALSGWVPASGVEPV
ncbi:MAG: tetratricopeptide repeat protein [Acidobacteriota bacterium]